MTSNINITNDPILTNIYKGYMPKDQDFVRGQLLPKQNLTSESVEIIELGTKASSALQVHGDYVTGTAGTPEIEVTITKGQGPVSLRHGLKIAITKDIAKKFDVSNWRNGFDKAERYFTKVLKKTNMVSRDKGLADIVFAAANFSATNKATLVGVNQWSDYTNSDPIGDTNAAFQAINDAVGFIPNVAVMNMQTFLTIRHNTKLKMTIAVSPNGAQNVRALLRDELAQALGVEKIIVANVKYETANKGATSSKAQIWGKNLLFAYVNPNPQPEVFEESFGYTFVLDETVIDTYEANDPKYVKYVRSDGEFVDYILQMDAGYLITDVIA